MIWGLVNRPDLPRTHEKITSYKLCLFMRLFFAKKYIFPSSRLSARKEIEMKNITENTLGARIKAQRIRCGMTQEELAEVMCIPKSTISAYEDDKVDIKSSVIVELAKYLETDANYLLGMEDTEDGAFINEAMKLLKQIKDEKVKRLLLKQIAAVVEE